MKKMKLQMKPQKKNKLNKILSALSIAIGDNFGDLDQAISDFAEKVKKDVTLKSLGELNSRLDEFKKDLDLSPIISAIDDLKNESGGIYDRLSQRVEKDLEEIILSLREGLKKLKNAEEVVVSLSNEVVHLKSDSEKSAKLSEQSIKEISDKHSQTRKSHEEMASNLGNSLLVAKKEALSIAQKELELAKTENSKEIKNLKELIDDLRIELLGKIVGSGNMNRRITVGGVDYLTKYTDINFVAGTDVGITVADDNTNKRVNMTISASGAAVTFETPVGDVNDTNTTFTVANNPIYLIINGMVYTEGNGTYTSYLAGTITLSTPVGTGGFIVSAY